MEQIRIGNDIYIAWSVFSHRVVDGADVVEPYDLTGKDIKLEAYNSIRKEIIPIQSVEGNVISTIFYGKDQKYAGEYTLTLVENDGKENMHTIDACSAFKLVRRTCELEPCTCGDNDNIEVYSLKLSSSFDVGVVVNNDTGGSVVVDAELSLESENAVQNKVITEALNGKQDAIADLDAIREGAAKGATALQEEQFKGTYSLPEGGIPKDDLSRSVQESLGKADTAIQEHQSLEGYATKEELEGYVEKKDGYGLSQEDFTTALKNKLSGLENYDDAEVQAAIEALGKRLDALVGTSASEAIDTFNEIVAFLNGVEDTATLEGILADIGKQISAVEAKIPTDYVKPSELSAVATSGSYEDLEDKPTIPNAVTEEDVSGWGFTKNEGTVTSIKIGSANKTPNSSGVVTLNVKELSTSTLSGSSTKINIYKNYIYFWALDNKAVSRTVELSTSGSNYGECVLWIKVNNTKPAAITFKEIYSTDSVFCWKNDKSPQFDVNKVYCIRFEWAGTTSRIYASWEEYPLVSNEGQTIPITVIDLNIKTSYLDAMNDTAWSERYGECLGFLRGDRANSQGYTCPKADIIGLQEIYMHGSQWEDIQDYFSTDYSSIIANRGDSSTLIKDSEAVAILYRKDRFTRVSGGFFWLRGGGWNGDTGDFNKEGVSMWDKEAQQMENYEPYKRIAVWIILRDISTGKEFFVLNTHYDRYFYIDGKTPASTPYYSSELVKNRIEALSGGRPVIFMGDLYCNPDKSAIAILKPTYYKLHDTRDRAAETFGMKYTMNSWAEESTSPTYALFDYIFTTDDFEVNQFIVPYAKVNGTWISDHNPVIADLYLKV